jgi:hypothetical protein
MERFRGITIDARKSKKVQREMFFHEFCHILRHAGIHSMMPEAFHELQEWDAKSFVRYAAIPHHMLKFIDFDNPYVIDQMVSLFKVTSELCEDRLLQIQKKLFREFEPLKEEVNPVQVMKLVDDFNKNWDKLETQIKCS